MRLLLDENLPPMLEARGIGRGYDARSATAKGKASALCGRSDDEVLRYARSNDMIVMTANGRDFIGLFRKAGGDHPGFILVKQEYPPRKSLQRQGLIDAFDAICDDLDAGKGNGLRGKALYYKWLGGSHHLRLDDPPYPAFAGW